MEKRSFLVVHLRGIFTRQCLFLLLQEGWEILPNEADGRPYYVNEATGASQWEQPSAS